MIDVTSHSNPQADEVLQAGNQFNSLKTQMSISFNLLFSLFGTFGLVYFMTKQFGYDSSQVSSTFITPPPILY